MFFRPIRTNMSATVLGAKRTEGRPTISKLALSRVSRGSLLCLRLLCVLTWILRPGDQYFSCVPRIRWVVATFEGASSSLSFPFEGFDEMFVTKSGIVVTESSRSSTTASGLMNSAGQLAERVISYLRSGLTRGFFLKEVCSSSSSPSSPPKLRSFVSLGAGS